MELNLDLFSNFCEAVWNPYSGSSPIYQDLSLCNDRPVKKAIVDFPIRLKGILKPTSSNLLSLLEALNKDLGTASQRLLIRVTLHLWHTLTRKELLKNFYDWGFSRPYSVDNDVTLIFTQCPQMMFNQNLWSWWKQVWLMRNNLNTDLSLIYVKSWWVSVLVISIQMYLKTRSSVHYRYTLFFSVTSMEN